MGNLVARQNLIDEILSSGLFSVGSGTYPPSNVYYKQDGTMVLEMAVAGFTKEDIDVIFDGHTLTVTGKRAREDDTALQWVRRGISMRDFEHKYGINGQYEPLPPSLKNGILTVELRSTNEKRKLEIT